MFEGGVLPCVPAGGAAGTLSAPAQDVSAGAVTCPESVAGLLGSLAAGGELAGVVEGLLARLLVTAQDHDDDGDGDGCPADGDAAPALLAGESGADATLVAAAEGHRVVSVEEAGASEIMGLGAWGLGELAAACRRLVAWASWGEALAAACLTSCGELSAHPGQWGPDGRVSSVVGFEERRFNTTCLLSARLGVSRSRAGQIVDHGSALMDMGFNPTEVMERCGVLDAAKASLVTRRLGDVPAPVALAVQERVLPQAPRRSVSQVGRDIERALMEVDPAGHAERVRVNVSRRCVSRPRPAGEGLSQIRLVLPTMDALLLDATLDAIAASARACGEQRTLVQLRADALGAMALSTLRTSQQTAFTQPSPKEAEHDGEAQAEANLSGSATQARLLPDGVPLEGLLSSLSSLVGSASPWWTPSGTGHLALPAGIHVDVQVTVPLTSLTDPGGLAQPEDATDHTPAAHGPGGREPFTSIGGNRLQDSDHGGYVPEGRAPKCGVPESAERPEGPCHPKSGRASPDKSPTIVTPDPLNDAASPHDRRGLPTTDGRSLLGSSGRSLPVPDPATPAFSCSAAHDSSPAASLSTALIAQPAASPAEVAEVRIGARSTAVPALTAWALAAGGTWRRLITDPASGTVVDVGRSRYRPPAGLADLVRARDRACIFPTCQTPAERCDIDHLTAWSQGGTTSLDNLVVLCEAHHRLKHTPGWALTRNNTSGTLSWHTPDKTVYQRHPDGTITRLPKRVGPRQRYVPGSVVPADLSKQISPEIINRLNTALNNTSTSTGTGIGSGPTARLETRGPQPGQKAGAYETTPYPKATHTLGLAPLIDEAPPF
ncbi:HNH endonuclease signature motif containing protein [Actinomyces oris]|uniref:HNH endonuclease signature motif containing protein n=1 Tax=Actinomyces oris TaxID=544580 RepID=UPI0009D70D61|nr:HNH endonuclease signature motif containing protein [Actinomyces oris]